MRPEWNNEVLNCLTGKRHFADRHVNREPGPHVGSARHGTKWIEEMTALSQDVVADLKARIADLERRLQTSLAERDEANTRRAFVALENARLFNETREALERQTATADILKVIASSPSDVQPVFEAIAERSNRLVEGFSTAVYILVDDTLYLKAFTRNNPEGDAALQASFPRPLSELSFGEHIRDGEIVQIPDIESTVEMSMPALQDMARLRGFRGVLFVPLLRDRATIGMISVTRKEPGAFAAHHVQLLQTFADQAVIAIENVRLFDEVQAKTGDLTEALQQQTATADVLKVISRSAFDLQAVLTTLVRSALDLCNAPIGTFFLREGDVLRVATQVGCPPELVQYFQSNPIPLNQSSGAGRAFSTGRVVHFPDVLSDPDYRLG